jgi:F-type H+-transporting ATPase subunit delta
MAEPSTVARPYAEAVFKLADGEHSLGKWSEALSALALVAQDGRVRALVGDPNRPDSEVAQFFIGTLPDGLGREGDNLVHVLTQNKRLELLPEIHAQYEMLKNASEGVVEAQLMSAFELTQAQVGDLVQRLEKRTGRKVKAKVSIDKDLIGGLKVVLGDKVIDGSARAQLGALENALKA